MHNWEKRDGRALKLAWVASLPSRSVDSRHLLHPDPPLPPALAPDSCSSSGNLHTTTVGKHRKFLDYEQEPVQVQEEEKEKDEEEA